MKGVDMMTKSEVLEVSLKIMGVYCLVYAVFNLPSVISALSTLNNPIVSNKQLYVVSCVLPTVMAVIMSYILISYSRPISSILLAKTTSEEIPCYTLTFRDWLSMGVILLGLHYFVGSVYEVLLWLGVLCSVNNMHDTWAREISNVCMIPLSLILIFRSRVIVNLITALRAPANKE